MGECRWIPLMVMCRDQALPCVPCMLSGSWYPQHRQPGRKNGKLVTATWDYFSGEEEGMLYLTSLAFKFPIENSQVCIRKMPTFSMIFLISEVKVHVYIH